MRLLQLLSGSIGFFMIILLMMVAREKKTCPVLTSETSIVSRWMLASLRPMPSSWWKIPVSGSIGFFMIILLMMVAREKKTCPDYLSKGNLSGFPERPRRLAISSYPVGRDPFAHAALLVDKGDYFGHGAILLVIFEYKKSCLNYRKRHHRVVLPPREQRGGSLH